MLRAFSVLGILLLSLFPGCMKTGGTTSLDDIRAGIKGDGKMSVAGNMIELGVGSWVIHAQHWRAPDIAIVLQQMADLEISSSALELSFVGVKDCLSCLPPHYGTLKVSDSILTLAAFNGGSASPLILQNSTLQGMLAGGERKLHYHPESGSQKPEGLEARNSKILGVDALDVKLFASPVNLTIEGGGVGFEYIDNGVDLSGITVNVTALDIQFATPEIRDGAPPFTDFSGIQGQADAVEVDAGRVDTINNHVRGKTTEYPIYFVKGWFHSNGPEAWSTCEKPCPTVIFFDTDTDCRDMPIEYLQRFGQQNGLGIRGQGHWMNLTWMAGFAPTHTVKVHLTLRTAAGDVVAYPTNLEMADSIHRIVLPMLGKACIPGNQLSPVTEYDLELSASNFLICMALDPTTTDAVIGPPYAVPLPLQMADCPAYPRYTPT